ncbi:MAG: M48 family metallopeptidase [Clostridia bacterium]|jgi:predicted metal-dependent hydrolase|nr:M48 family metallopeptidase [Clostridia bacterium]
MDYRIKTAGGIVDFSLIRKNVKNIRLRVTDEAKVVVSAPKHTKQSTILKFVQDNADFVAERIERVEYTRLSSYPGEYRTGDMFSYLGRRTLMRVEKGERHGAKLSGGLLTIRVSDPDDPQMCKQSFVKWAKKQAKIVFAERLAAVLPAFEDLAEYGVRISVRDMKTRWGSINVKKHTMSLSVHLLRCEVALIDHIIKHELCHYSYQNHSKAFYDELMLHSPNTNAMRKRLKEYGLVGF